MIDPICYAQSPTNAPCPVICLQWGAMWSWHGMQNQACGRPGGGPPWPGPPPEDFLDVGGQQHCLTTWNWLHASPLVSCMSTPTDRNFGCTACVRQSNPPGYKWWPGDLQYQLTPSKSLTHPCPGRPASFNPCLHKTDPPMMTQDSRKQLIHQGNPCARNVHAMHARVSRCKCPRGPPIWPNSLTTAVQRACARQVRCAQGTQWLNRQYGTKCHCNCPHNLPAPLQGGVGSSYMVKNPQRPPN